jgi:hypothetical protein
LGVGVMTKNKRKFERHQIDLGVRFITREDLEECGNLINVSEGGLAMFTDATAEVGDEIIVYPEGLGRLTGVVKRKFGDGIAIEFSLSEQQREHLKKRIDSALTGVPYIRLLENRAHKRMTLKLFSEAKVIPGGEPFACQVIDISESGSRIRSEERPAIGSKVHVGALKGVVRRHTEDGFALEFVRRRQDENKECA